MYLVKEIKPETLKEIAEMLDMGMVCFYHKPSGEMDYYPDELKNPGFDEEPWAETISKIEENSDDYIRFEGMSSHEAFRVMEDFIAGIDHTPTHNRFIDAISQKKPFRNFDDLLGYYPDLRQQWFTYKSERYIAYVKAQV
ncbi:MAG TPA: UPF0158 family protein [Mucilaginibacter sp.]|jgi:hypothetical protein|nr:UPF0158 family protein [Mucilaginibacter sp.]